jgi:hypothetical protein
MKKAKENEDKIKRKSERISLYPLLINFAVSYTVLSCLVRLNQTIALFKAGPKSNIYFCKSFGISVCNESRMSRNAQKFCQSQPTVTI